MPTIATFRTLYKKLNPEQRKAVDTIEGPVMVIAGPGTGKTQILALRIAHILTKTDTAPENILALTFTESGVYSMRKRLVDIIGAAAYKLNIYTFHGFANEIIKTYPEDFPRIIGSNPATDIDQIGIMEEILKKHSFELLKPYGDPFYYLRPALEAVKNLKRENVPVEKFEALVKRQEREFERIPDAYHTKGAHVGKMKGEYADLKKKIEKNKELCLMYSGYEKALRKKKLYDFDDMIIELIGTLEKNADLLLRMQEKYHYILADEHQDANNGQNKILELLSNFHPNPNLFIVGDEKQAIFRFQGASLENFLYFKKLYPGAMVISLKDNYRSSQVILDSAHSLIVKNKIHDESLRVKLVARSAVSKVRTEYPKICVYEFGSADSELGYIARDIEKLIASGAKPSQIAVLYRDNRDAEPVIRCLEKVGVPFIVQSDQNVLADADIENLVLLIRTVCTLEDEESVAKLLYVDFLKLETLDVFKLTNFAARKKLGLLDILRSKETLEEAGVEGRDAVMNFTHKMFTWSSMAKNKGIVEAFETIVNDSGFLTHILSLPESVEKLAKLDRLFSEIKKISENRRSAKLQHAVAFVDTLETYNILLKTGVVGVEKDGVRLMTAHRSKGLEFEYVYIVGACDTHWGNKREIRHFHLPLYNTRVSGDPLEDERRLFYVALTRARRQVSISYARTGADGRERLPVQFLSEIDPVHLNIVDTAEFERQLNSMPAVKFSESKFRAPGLKDKEFLQNLFHHQGLSVTALNMFLRCPWEYFFKNLLRIPRSETRHQLYGIAVHAALKEFFNAYAREEDLTKKEFLTLFEGHMRKLPFSERDYEESLKKGKRALGGYLDAYKNSWPRTLITEFSIAGVHFDFETEDGTCHIVLRGVLDKIEFMHDGSARVVDYKTAQPKTRNAILGKTKDEQAPEFLRQLVFYKLLLDRYDTGKGKYRMSEGIIDFIEPGERGNYKREAFEINESMVRDLEQVVETACRSIHTLSFWNSMCDDKECGFCALRRKIG